MLDNYPYVILFLSMVIQVIIPPLPAELIVVSAGRAYGITVTTISAGAGLFTGSAVVYFIGRYIQIKLSRFFDRQKTKRVVERIRKIETLLLWVRILPYNPSDIISYAAGIVDVRLEKFLFVTACTSFIRVFLLSLLGTYITSVKTFFQVGGVLVISALIGSAIVYGGGKRKPRNKKP